MPAAVLHSWLARQNAGWASIAFSFIYNIYIYYVFVLVGLGLRFHGRSDFKPTMLTYTHTKKKNTGTDNKTHTTQLTYVTKRLSFQTPKFRPHV